MVMVTIAPPAIIFDHEFFHRRQSDGGWPNLRASMCLVLGVHSMGIGMIIGMGIGIGLLVVVVILVMVKFWRRH
jgi:hypothetical protein